MSKDEKKKRGSKAKLEIKEDVDNNDNNNNNNNDNDNKTHYNFLGMVQFAIGGVLSGSTFLLRLSYYLGIPLICFNICMLYFILLKSNYDKINFFIFLNIFYLVSFIPILSVYIARIYKDGVQRPLFVVDWKKSTIQKNN